MQANSSISSSDTTRSGTRGFALAFLVIVVVGVLVFIAGSEWIVRTRVAPRDDFEQHRLLFQSANMPVAFFGDSQVANTIQSENNVVNLGYPSETLQLMLFKAETYARSRNPKAIILQFAPQQFAIYRADNAQEGFREELSGQSVPWLQFTRPHFRRYLLAHWRVLLGQMLSPPKVASAAAAQESPEFPDWSDAEKRKSAEIRVQLHAPLVGGESTEKSLKSLTNALDSFRDNGIKTCLVRYPVTDAYRKGAESAPSFAALTDRVAGLANKHGIRFIDLSSAIPDEFFRDPDHVSLRKRAEVTAMILDRCLSVSN